MDKSERINELFNFFKQIKKENPNIHFFEKDIYKILTRFYIADNKKKLLQGEEYFDERLKRQGMFEHWTDRFMYKKNTKAFVSPAWDYFCQFTHGNLKNYNDGDFIKIYVPLDMEHIEIGANKLFEFINNKGIKHVSKISADIRFDDIVIRVSNKEDADTIIDFIKNDKYIQKGLYKPNPFAFNKDGLALACDGDESFNSILSGLLTQFINNTQKEHLNEKNFYEYLKNLYIKFFNREIDINRFINVSYVSYKPNSKDFIRVLELIIKSHNNNFSYNDFIEHFKNGLRSNIQNKSVNNNNSEYEIYMAIEGLSTKYSLEESIKRLILYVTYNKPQYITRKNGLRDRLIKRGLRSKILASLSNRPNINLSEYFYEILNKYNNLYNINYENEKRAAI